MGEEARVVTAILAWLAGSRVGRALAAVGAALAFIAGAWLAGRREGGKDARAKAKEADHEHADEIRARADDVRRNLDGDDSDWVRFSPANRDRD